MRIFTANIKSNPLMRQSRVESDIEHAVHLGGIGFWQEIAPRRYKAALARHAHAAKLRVFGISVECPVTLKTANWIIDASPPPHLMHHGFLHITPSRYVVEVRAHERNGAHRKVAFMGTHFISSAWSNKHRATRAWRRKRWFIHLHKLRALAAKAHADGYTVIVGMDANKAVSGIALHPHQTVISHHGIDGVIAVPASGLRATHSGERVIKGLFTDHDPVVVTSTLLPVK